MPGVITIAVRPVRIGSNLSTWDAIVQDSSAKVVAAATVIAAAARTSSSGDVLSPLQASSAPPSDQVPVVATPPPFPEFTRRLWTPGGRLAVDNLQTKVVGRRGALRRLV